MTKEELEDGGPAFPGVTRGLALINARFRVVDAAKRWAGKMRDGTYSHNSTGELFAAIDALRELEKEQVK